MSHHKIEAKNLEYIYPDGHKALNSISFLITHGESVGVIGANGAGKSTLLLSLMGVLFPTSGQILVGDVPVTKKTLSHIREHLGMVFQNPDDQLFMTTVYDDVAFGPRNYGLDETEVDKRVTEALGVVGIPHLKDRAPYKLSGGEKRSAAIASVLSMQPDALILDEPTSELDPKARRRVMELLGGFKHTKIIASHDMDMIYDLCERTIVVQNGVVRADGKTKELILDRDLMDSCGLEIPLRFQS
ncbi:MAG: ABC transporter ATP-binding protein [Eubacteriales bacterium]